MDKAQFLQFMSTDFPYLQVSMNDLENPSADFIKRFYSAMLDEIIRIPIAELYNFSEEQREFLKSCSEGSFLLNHVSSYNLYSAIKFTFDQIELFQSEFHFSDVLIPHLSPKRSYVFMVTMYFLTGSCADFDSRFQEQQNLDEKNSRIAKLTKEQEILKKQLDDNEKNKIEFAEKIVQMKKKLAMLSQVNNDVENELKELQHDEDTKLNGVRRLEEQERKAQEDFNKIDSEKKYYESLIVSDESQVLSHHGSLQSKNEECLKNLHALEKQVQERLTMVSQLDKVLGLQETLKATLHDEIASASGSGDLRALYDTLCSSKQLCDALAKEATEIKSQLNEKKQMIPEQMDLLKRLKEEKDEINLKLVQKVDNHKKKRDNLKKILHDLTQRYTIEEASLENTRQEIKELQIRIADKTAKLKSTHETMTKELDNSVKSLENQLLALKDKASSYCENNMENY